MNTDERERNSISIDDAINISKILCKAPEERIPMILSVLEKADVSIDGLADLEEWKALKDQAYLIDVQEFVEELKDKFRRADLIYKDHILIPVKEFSDFCRSKNLKPILVKRILARMGYIETYKNGDTVEYTQPAYISGKVSRYVIIYKERRKP